MAYSKRYNVSTPIPTAAGGTYWQRLGTGFLDANKGHITVLLNAYPIPDSEGKVKMFLFESKNDNVEAPPKKHLTLAERQSAEANMGRADGKTLADELDDEIPF